MLLRLGREVYIGGKEIIMLLRTGVAVCGSVVK